MKHFSTLFEQIDQTQSTNEKVFHIEQYFTNSSSADCAWALFFLSGHRLKRFINGRKLLLWCQEILQIPNWLLEESYAAVGDTAETISLLLPTKEIKERNEQSLAEWMEERIKPLQGLSDEEQKSKIFSYWNELSKKEIFVLNKILTGSFRLGISSLLTLKALSQSLGVSREILSQRVMGTWQPTPEFFQSLNCDKEHQKYLNPYPFYLAHPFEGVLNKLGSPSEWLAEWKWDGIRTQVIVKDGNVAIWSRGNELISLQFPEILEACQQIPDGTVLDGEMIAYQTDGPLPFGELQKRLGRKNISKKMQKEIPVMLIIYDLLEYQSKDIRNLSLVDRRHLLTHLPIQLPEFLVSEEIPFSTWEELKTLRELARGKNTEGVMLKKRTSAYGVGRQKGSWWKYKVDPMTIDAVLMYAQAGSGRRANLFTDYTFGVWKGDELVPIAKAYSGLDQQEIVKLDRWIRSHTEEKFGPVRKVQAEQVFEIAFEGIQQSNRHKSGIALRFPRIKRWRTDKLYQECDMLENIIKMFLHD
jgi:DNA ligase-1